MPSNRIAAFAAVLLAVWPAAASAYDSLIIPVGHSEDAELPAAGVTLFPAPPPSITFPPGSAPSPAQIAPGGVNFYSYFYSVQGGIPPGTVPVPFSLPPSGGLWERHEEEDLVVEIPVGAVEEEPSDRTPPVTARTLSGPWTQGPEGVVLSSLSRVGFSPFDPLVGGEPTSQIAGTWIFLDSPFVDTATTPGTPWDSAPFALAPGSHTLSWYSADLAGNLEIPRFSAVLVDDGPPVTGGFSPGSAEVFGGARSSFTVAWSLFDDADPSPVASARLLQVEDTGSVNAGSSIVVVAFGQLVLADALDDGLWALEVNAADWVQNSTRAVSAPFQIVHGADSTPPATQLTLGPPSVIGDPSFVSSSTLISLAATDDLSGVASLTYSIDGATTVVLASSTSFTLTQEGSIHTLAYSAADVAGNIEAVQVSSIVVDATPPVLSFSVSDSSSTDRLGRVIISTSTLLVLAASDAASGVGTLTYSLDGAPEVSLAVSSTSLSFPDEGTHTLSFNAQDRVENRSPSFTTSVVVDVSPPSFGELTVAGADGSSGSDSTAISTTAASVQISVEDLASGLDVTGAGSGPGPLSAILGTLGLWHFDEGSGGSARDSSANAIHGVRNPNVSWLADGAVGSAVRVTPLPNSTPNAGVTLPPSAYALINNLPSGTVELWARLPLPRGPSYYTAFTVKQFDGSDTQFWFAINADGQLWHPANSQSQCVGSYNAPDDRWHHFAATWDGSTQKLYVDGALNQTCSGAGFLPNGTNPTCLSIAGACGDQVIGSQNIVDIDEVRVVNRALSAAEISQDASAQAKPFAVRLSVDGGASFSAPSAVDLPGLDGAASGVLSASGLTLKASTSPLDSTNLLEFTARDLAGHAASVRKVVLVNLNRTALPVLAAPPDQFSSSVPLVAFSWSPGPGVPEASITGYEFQYAKNDGFTQGLVTLSPSTNSLSVSLPEGAFYWRVAALDRFGDKSPYSAPRAVFIDSQPPAFSEAQVSTAPGSAFRPASLPVNALLVDARALVQDLASGLRLTPVPGGPVPLSAVPGTLGLWHFDEASGSVALGEGPAGNGTLNPNVTRVPGILGGAVKVGVQTTFTPQAGVTLGPGSYSVINDMPLGTIELWAKLVKDNTNVNNMAHIFTVKHHDGVDTEFEFSIQKGVTNQLWHPSNGVDCNTLIDADPTRWYHFAATWDTSAARLYLDGVLIRTCPGGFAVPNDPNPTCLSIAGGCGHAALSDGERLIDEVRVLSRALSPAEIAQDAAVNQAAMAFSAALSTDGGLTFRQADGSSVSLTGVDGTTSTETMTARGLALVESASPQEPLNVVRFSAADLAGRSTDFYFSVLADTTPPSVAVTSPAAGSVFSALAGAFTPLVEAADRLDPAPSIAAELVQLSDEGGNGLLDRVTVSTGFAFDASLLDTGSWELRASALDFAGNASSSASGAFRIERDILPPRTSLVVEGPQVQRERLFITPQTEFSLSATDDLLLVGDGAGLGVAGSSYSIDSETLFSDYAGTFSIVGQTAHDLRYFSTDKAGHIEAVKLTSAAVDGTGPAVSLGYQSPFRVAAGTTTVFVQGLGPLFVSATDYPDLAVGTSVVYRSVDGGPAVASPSPFSLPEGMRALSVWALDALGNQGPTVSASLKLDATPPAAVGDLLVAALSSAEVRVSWTAPGDDGLGGDIFDAAVRLDFGTDPGNLLQSLVLSSGTLGAGAAFERAFSGLAVGTSYYARAYTRDSAGNWSAPSPLASAKTFTVAVSQDQVASVVAPVPVEVAVVSTVTEAQAYTVAISSQGLTPSGTVFYELTSGLTFDATAPALISFTFDPALVDPDSVLIYTYDLGLMQWVSDSITNQTLTVLAADLYQISGEILHTSLYAPMVRDTAAPLTAFSVLGSSAVLEGRLFAVGGSSGVLSAQDLAPRGGVASGVAATLYRGGEGSETAFMAPFPLPEGEFHVSFHSLDRAGNAETPKGGTVFVDAGAPLISFSADQSTFAVPGGFGTLSATVTVTVAATDPGSGLASFSALLDGNPIPVSAGVLLGAGLHTLALNAADRLGNESSLTLKVAVGDTLPPVTTLIVDLPKVALPDGSLLVGAATELRLEALDFAESGAPAGVAQTRYRFGNEPTSVYDGAFNVPGPDGDKVLGYYSTDRAGNAEDPPKTQALVRDATPPALAFTFPRPDEAGLCRLAQRPVSLRGTVADPHLAGWSLKDGAVVLGSGTQETDGVLGVWDATGKVGAFTLTLSASDLVENSASASLTLHAGQPLRTLALGGKKALNKPRGVAWAPNRVYVADTNADQVRVYDASANLLASFGDKRRALRLNKPAGLAVDSVGNIFVADANNKRVVKLSPAGILLREYGGKRVLEKPVAVALSGGNILVADAHAGEVVVFSEAGALLRRVALPSIPVDHHDDDDADENEARPMALAAEASGAFWVADSKGARVLRYDAGFNLVQTIPGFARPEGLAVSPSGACLAVVDSKSGSVRTFDAASGSELAAFGKDNLHKPAQAVFTADGQLLVANRNEDQVTGFGLPGTPIVIAMTQPKGGFRASGVDETPSAPVVARVGRVEGGFVEEPGGAAVEVPAGAVSQDLDISVAVVAEAGVAERTAQNLIPASSPREFGPHGQSFTVPVTITLPYDPNLVSGVRPEELKIHYWNAERSVWEALASRVDADAHTVSAQTSHFSLYQVLAPVRSLSLMADPEATFFLRSVYAFPNPAVGGQKPTIHAAVGKADRVTIRIYDIAGTPVHEATLDGSPSVVNDDTGAHFAYEYSWGGHIPSGVYLYTVTAEKAGQAPIKRIGKVAVVR